MEYKYLKVKNNSLFKIKKDINNNGIKDNKYERVLKNLLQIKTRGDSSIFTILNKQNIDLYTLLKKEDIDEIYNNHSFKIKIPRTSIEDIKRLLDSIEYKNELYEFLEQLNISSNFLNLYNFDEKIKLKDQENWELFENEVVKINKESILSFNSRWTRFVKNVNDIYEQSNIWPLYIGAYFVKCNINGKAIYAPLIYKDVEIVEEKNDMFICSKNDSLIINEKFLFFLEEYKNINIPKISEEIEKVSFFDCSKELTSFFKEIIKFNDFSELGKFKKLKAKEILEPEISRETGIILSICNPIGSGLRKAVIELIANNKLNDILINSNGDIFGLNENFFIENIIEKQSKIPKICKTDLSQEKAILSSLEDSTIIIGPPGTGKSQTIANIMANILYEGKSAIFISQKKVALQVVLERLKDLRYFTLQLVENYKKISANEKEDFYHNLKSYLQIISEKYSYNKDIDNDKSKFTPIISNDLVDYWKSKKINISNEEFEIFCRLKNAIGSLDNELIDFYSIKKSDFQNLTESSLNSFKELSKILDGMFNKNFVELISKNIDGLNNLNSSEINGFVYLQKIYNSINTDKMKFLLHNKEKILSNEWSIIGVFNEIYELMECDKNNIYEMLFEINNIFSDLLLIKKLDYIDKMYVLTYVNKIETFAKEFGVEKKSFIFFKKWDKEIKKFWKINLKFKNIVEKFSISRILINFLYMKKDYLSKFIKEYEFYNFLSKNKINHEIYDAVKNNINNLHSWIRYYDFLSIVNKYTLDEKTIDIIKNNKSHFGEFLDKFDFYSLINNHKINYEDVQLINQVNNPENIKIILDTYEKFHSKFVPKTNEFHDDLEVILDKVVTNAYNIGLSLDKDEKYKFNRLKGRIVSSRTKPYLLISLFKDIFKKLFRVVVSTPESLSTYIDFINEEYDYVIFDEASQMFLEKAIPFLAIGKKIIVAGDNQQMQPTNWFGLRAEEANEDDLEYENIDSLLDYAINSGIRKQTLELNYRSEFANLTTFSSKHFYESKLKCLDNNRTCITDSIEVIDVNGKWEDNVNENEARAMVNILKKNIDKYEKIILLTFNANQMDLVDFIISTEEPEIYKKISIDRTIILKNLENIQGDEADLVIISVAYTKETKLSGTYVCRLGGSNALNVAITRAKSKMIVLKSIFANEINSKDNNNIQLFRYWLNFIEASKQEQRSYSISNETIQKAISMADSNFEIDVIKWLSLQKFSKNISILSQYEIGSYRIDIAIVDKQTNKFIVGLEVDGFRYHSTTRQKYNDEIRQNFIEAKGYKILRIPEMLWRTNKQKIFHEINLYIEK